MRVPFRLRAALLAALIAMPSVVRRSAAQERPPATTVELPFRSHDGYEMLGRLTVPAAGGPHPVVIYVQTAEGMTIDMRRPDGRGGTFDYFDLYATRLPPLGVGFFRYEGRGIRTGDRPPRYEVIDRDVYDTSTLENKVRDALAAVRLVRAQPGVDPARVYLMGASEGTLLAAEAAARAPGEVAGLVLYAVMSGTMREMFAYIMTDGGFLAYRGYFDTDGDGRISRAEFEADPHRYRERVFRNADFAAFDRDGDGEFTAADMRLVTRHFLDAIATENFTVLDAWAKTAAGVSTPAGWFRDHFAHETIWTFLRRLDVPVGLFHGSGDPATPIEGVKRLETLAREAGRANLRFHYFAGADHSLDLGAYLTQGGELPLGHRAIFAFIADLVGR